MPADWLKTEQGISDCYWEGVLKHSGSISGFIHVFTQLVKQSQGNGSLILNDADEALARLLGELSTASLNNPTGGQSPRPSLKRGSETNSPWLSNDNEMLRASTGLRVTSRSQEGERAHPSTGLRVTSRSQGNTTGGESPRPVEQDARYCSSLKRGSEANSELLDLENQLYWLNNEMTPRVPPIDEVIAQAAENLADPNFFIAEISGIISALVELKSVCQGKRHDPSTGSG